MQKFYKWFDYFLNLVLVGPIIISTISLFDLNYISQHYQNGGDLNQLAQSQDGIRAFLGNAVTALFIISLFFGVVYVIIGIIFIIRDKRKKQNVNTSFGKGLLIKGLIRGIIAFFFFFFISLALSFFGLDMGEGGCGGLCLPKIPDLDATTTDPNTPGFPVKDLVIIDRKAIVPQMSGDNRSCDLTIQNNSATMSAVSLTFDKDASNNADDDSIAPGSSKVINVYPNGNSQTACDDISVTSAEILNPNASPEPSLSPSPSQ